MKEIQESREFPFFIQWLTTDHPSKDGSAAASLESILINDADQLADSWFKDEIIDSLKGVKINWAETSADENEKGIIALNVKTPKGVVLID